MIQLLNKPLTRPPKAWYFRRYGYRMLGTAFDGAVLRCCGDRVVYDYAGLRRLFANFIPDEDPDEMIDRVIREEGDNAPLFA